MLKFASLLWLLILLIALVACGTEAAPTAPPAVEATLASTGAAAATAEPTETPRQSTTVPSLVPATEAPPRATATVAPTVTAEPTAIEGAAPRQRQRSGTATPAPAAPPPTEAPQLNLVEIPPDHPAAQLALLPDSMMYAYINLETVWRRPDLQEHVEFQLAHFVSLDELPFAEELLVSVGADVLLLSSPFRTYEWAIVLQGDFTRLAEVLRTSAESGVGLSIDVIDTHREIDIFALVRTKSSGRQSEIYLTLMDSEALAASADHDAVREMIDRHIDGGRLPEDLAILVEDWGLSDFLEAFPMEGSVSEDRPTDAAWVFAFHAELSDGSTTTLRALQQYDDEEQAAAAVAWLNEQPEPHWRNIGWGGSAPIDQWRRKGSTVYGEAVVPDEDMPALVQGN